MFNFKEFINIFFFFVAMEVVILTTINLTGGIFGIHAKMSDIVTVTVFVFLCLCVHQAYYFLKLKRTKK